MVDITAVQEWLKANKKTKAWLAKQLGVHKLTVYNWCSGKYSIPSTKQALLRVIMGASSADDETLEAWAINFEETTWRQIQEASVALNVPPQELASRLARRLANAMAAAWLAARK